VVVGLGRGRADWAWRAAVGGGVAVWAVVWGPVFLQQASNDWAGWIPPTSVSAFVDAVGGQVTNATAVRALVTVAVGAGGLLLWRRDRELGRVWAACGALPFLLAAAIGLVSPFLVDRTLTVAAWAAPLALGVLGDAAIRRGGRVAAVAVLAIVLLVGLGAVAALAATRDDTDRAIDHLEAVVRPGDVIVTRPARYATLADYRIAVERWQHPVAVPATGIDNASGVRDGAAPATRRLWLFSPVSFGSSFPGYRACTATGDADVRAWSDGTTQIHCLERDAGPAGKSRA
jgi:hypothetical protein